MIYYCISLPGQTERRLHMQQQFHLHSLNVNWFDAIRPSTENFPNIYQRQKRLNLFGYDLTQGEIGCYLSHRAVWQQFVNTANKEELCCVFEDDIQLANNFNSIISMLAKTKKQWDYVRLFSMFPSKEMHVTTTLPTGHQLFEFVNKPCGTQGYVLSYHAAQKLLKLTEKMYLAIDDAIDQIWRHELKMLCISPFLVSEETRFDSSIGLRQRPKLSITVKLKRELHRIPNELHRKFWQYKTRLRWFQNS